MKLRFHLGGAFVVGLHQKRATTEATARIMNVTVVATMAVCKLPKRLRIDLGTVLPRR